ncbi:tetratricopeptide repeat protein [Rickettsia endosymbiont of Orchestes rusci]|uniref:tetratricopeptide repeat protein n=1 Tax=Rickettsia endosymbiont of Orchestes rusci TaxID=3066250 RepID=UPI00313B9B5F
MKHITKERLQLIKQINTIFTSLTEIYNKTEEITEKGILVLGAIGGGKSALVASLINHELKIIYNSDKKVYQLENFSNSDLKIHNNPSTTPNILNKYKIGDTVIWDCPGFEINKYSPRNITQILINLFSLKRLFKVTNELQFIIVTPESSITEESGGFYLIIEKFTNIFLKSELEKLKNSVALVITKGEAELENINESVRNIINKSDPTIQKFFNNLSLSGSSFIKIFHKIPQEAGLFTSKIKFEDFKLDAVNVKLRPLNFSLNGHQNIISELYTKIELNIAQISGIITRTFDEKNFDYYKPVNCRIFFDDYDSFIKKILLPSDKNYILLPSAKAKYFQGLQQIFKFHKLMEKNNDNPKNLVIELLDIIEKFSEEPQQQEQIHNYSYILKQQTEYLLFFGEILKAAPSDSDYLFNRVIKHCKTTVNKIFMPFIKDIKLKKSIDDKYYEEAIWWLNKYKPPEEINETKALARFNIGTIYSKKGELRNAWDNFNQALNYNKKLILPYKEIGNILEQLAIKPNKNDDYYKVTLNLAIKYYKIADYDTGILKCFEALIKKNPKDPDLYIQKGDYLLTKKIYSDALKAYSAAKDITDNSFKRNDIALKILKFEISKTEPAPIIDYGNIHVAEIDKAERDLNFVKITGDNNANLG